MPFLPSDIFPKVTQGVWIVSIHRRDVAFTTVNAAILSCLLLILLSCENYYITYFLLV